MLLINSILPIFLLILLGWILARKKIVPLEIVQHLTQYVFWIASPAIIFSSISSYHLSQILAWQSTIAHVLMVVIVGIVTYYSIHQIFRTNRVEAVIASFTTTVKNTIMIGLPVLMGIVGPQAAIPMTITVIFFNCILTPLLMLIFELNQATQNANSKRQIIKIVMKNLIKNPMIVAAVLGIIFAAGHLHLPTPLNTLISYVAPSFVPCALFAVGVDLCAFKLEGNHSKLLLITLLNLLLCPLVAIVIAFLLQLSAFYATSLVVLAALPTAKSVYIYARKYQLFEKETAAVISLTTVLSIITIPCFVYVSYWLWPAAF